MLRTVPPTSCRIVSLATLPFCMRYSCVTVSVEASTPEIVRSVSAGVVSFSPSSGSSASTGSPSPPDMISPGLVGCGGMMMLLILTSVLGYELKTAVGTSVFIMTFTALTGAVSHFTIGGAPDWTVFILCVVFTFLWARIAAVIANRATPKTLNRATGVILMVLGIVVLGFGALA